jgi:hypothetical protein
MAGPAWPIVHHVEFTQACPGCGQPILWRMRFPDTQWTLEGPCACEAA